MNNRILILCLLCLMQTNAEAITRTQFDSTISLIQSSNFDSTRILLSQFEQEEPIDPEYYVLNLNYYFVKSKRTEMRISNMPPQTEQPFLELADSTGKTAGFMVEESEFDYDTLMLGVSAMQKGLDAFPDRLDMLFGLAHVFESAELYKEMTSILVRILKRSRDNQQTWQWSFSEPLKDDPVEFVLGNIQSRVSMLTNLETELSDSMVIEIANEMILSFPNSTYGSSNLGFISQKHNDLSAALSYYLTAYKVDSSDGVVIFALAALYEDMDRINEARHYYELLLDPKNGSFGQIAAERLSELENKK